GLWRKRQIAIAALAGRVRDRGGQRGGSAPGPANFLNSSTVSGSRGSSRIDFSLASGIRGVGSSPTSLWYSLKNSGSRKVLRNASLMISKRSLGVAGGAMNGEPASLKLRNI